METEWNKYHLLLWTCQSLISIIAFFLMAILQQLGNVKEHYVLSDLHVSTEILWNSYKCHITGALGIYCIALMMNRENWGPCVQGGGLFNEPIACPLAWKFLLTCVSIFW